MEKQSASIKVTKTKFFWAFFILAAFGLALGTFLLPVWKDVDVFWKNWYETSISIILFCVILLYVVWYLLKMIKQEDRKAIKVLSIIEMSLLGIVAIGCLLQHFGVLSFIGPCFVFGAIFWLRGCIYIVKAYFYQHKKKESFSVTMLVLSIVLVTGGTYFMSNKFDGNNGFIWIVSVTVLVLSLALIVYGIMAKPNGNTVEEAKPETVKPAAKPEAKPVEKPTESKPDKPAAKPAKPASKPAEDKPTESKPAKPASSKPTNKPADKPAKPAKPAEDKPTESKPAKPASSEPTDKPVAKPAKPAKPAVEKPADKPVEKPAAKPATDKPAETEQN